MNVRDLLTEIHRAIRRMRSTPVVTLTAIVCLSVGVWMACVVSAVGRGFFRPNLHVPNPERLVQLDERGLFDTDVRSGRITSPAVIDSLKHRGIFSAVGFYDPQRSTAIDGDHDQRVVVRLSSGMMAVLNATPAVGRVFIPADDHEGNVAILSYDYWQTAFGGDVGVIGRLLRIQDERAPRVIVGVMRENFGFPLNDRRPAAYLPPARPSVDYPARRMLARLADGVSLTEARRVSRDIALRRVAADRDAMLAWQHSVYRRSAPPPIAHGAVDVRLERYFNDPVDVAGRRIVSLAIACGFGVAAVAVIIVINLILIRGAARRQEVAVRLALGASRSRIVGELMIESALLAGAGVAIGLIVASAQWRLLEPSFEARHMFGDIDATAAAIAGLLFTIAVGVWPGLRASSLRIDEVLRDVRRAGIGASPLEGLIGRLVAGSMAITVTLLVCATMLGLSARDFARQHGVLRSNLYASSIEIDSTISARQRGSILMSAVDRVRAIPGIERVAIGEPPPYGESRRLVISAVGHETQVVRADMYTVSHGYFETAGIPLLAGRSIDARDSRDSTGAVVVSRALADRLFPAGQAVGQPITYRDLSDSNTSTIAATVVGVADTAGVRGLGWALFVGYGSASAPRSTLVMRIRGTRAPGANEIGSVIRNIPGVSATNATLTTSRLLLQVRRYLATGFGMFAVIGLLLAAIGTYGVVAYSVVRRTHEIGVRMALGADRARVVGMILAQGLRLTLIGLGCGLVLALGAARLLEGVVEDVSGNYSLAIAGIMLLVGVISLIASAVPGYRASRLNPVDCLRAE